MKGLLDGDKALQLKSLQGLIQASQKLGLDPTRYRNALRILQPESTAVKRSAAKSSTTPAATPRPPAGKAKASIEKVPAGAKPVTIRTAGVKGGKLVLTFGEALPEGAVRHFVLKKRLNYLYVFDLKPTKLPYSIKRIKGAGFKEIRIAQYDPRKVRVVIETMKRYKPVYEIGKGRFSVTLPGYVPAKPVPKGHRPTPAKAAAPKPEKPKAVLPKAAAKPSSSLPPIPLRRYTVVIDPGHGGKDSGAVGFNHRKEKNAVLAVAKRLRTILQKRGFRVYMTRSTDIFIPLKRRTRYANRKGADFFISIHANAAPNRRSATKHHGLETYFLSPARSARAKRVAAIENSAEIKNIDRYTKEAYLSMLNRAKIIESNKLAIDLQRQMLTSLRSRYKVVDNGVRKAPFWVLVGAQMPAVLIEIGYITHPVEGPHLFNSTYQRLLAEGIANGLESYIIHNQ
ncbi:N-acetylmuramoyl-L-alanine amidase [Hydrogenimonas sp. SS33]|uniref:N-acetylmuramoyl-L-alanine amidase n=1 Tax=Hydrogenimonas leucolamina TaxID=2954236 RepID=UPI00336C1D82